MRRTIAILWVLISGSAFGQTTLTSGEWTDPTVWSGGAVPAAGGTVNVNHPQDILSNLSPTGDWTFNANATDLPGGSAYNFSPSAGTNVITIASGAVVTFTGNGSDFNSGTIDIYGTLILGATNFSNSFNLKVTVHSGGTLIINGTLTNNNILGDFQVDGAVIIYGDYDGGALTQLTGSGTIDATGSITAPIATVFGSSNDCTTGPCSGSTMQCTHANAISTASSTVCSGSNVTLNANTTGTSPTYQWESSINNTSWANAAGTSTNSVYTATALAVTTWYRVKKTVSGCTSTSGVEKITVLTGGGWKGTTNNWATASNWCSNSVPTSATDVIIANAAGIANMPVIAAGTGAVCNNLTIANTFPASSISIAASNTASLSIYGNFTNNGTFTDNSTAAAAGLKFTGSGTQTISGSTPATINNLTINSSGGVNVTSNNLAVTSNLTFTLGLINMNGFTLKLGASAASTGTLSYTTGYVYNGNFQRWYPTTAVAAGNASLFPVGSSLYYRSLDLISSGFSASGGTLKVSHTAIADGVNVSFADTPSTVIRRSNSYWTVVSNGISSTGTPLSMRIIATGMGTVNNVNHIRITRAAAAAAGADGTHGGSTTTPQANRTGISVASISNSYYWGSINAATTLPVELRWFEGRFVNNEVELSWKTESELNCDYFSVWHSSDGEEFREIGAVRGLGTSSTGKTYTLMHSGPKRGTNYYQLRQADFGKAEETLQVIRVEADPLAAFLTVYPNPVEEGTLHVEIDLVEGISSIEVSLIDLRGWPMLRGMAEADTGGKGTVIFDTSGLLPGMYIVHAGAVMKRIVIR